MAATTTRLDAWERELRGDVRRARRLVSRIAGTDAGLLTPAERRQLEELVGSKGPAFPATPEEAASLRGLPPAFDPKIVWWLGRVEGISRDLEPRLRPRIRRLQRFVSVALEVEDDLGGAVPAGLKVPAAELDKACTILCGELEILGRVAGVLRRLRGETCDVCDEPEDDVGPDRIPGVLLLADEALRANRPGLFLPPGTPAASDNVAAVRFLREVPGEDLEHLGFEW